MNARTVSPHIVAKEIADVLIRHGVLAVQLDDVFKQAKDVAFNRGIRKLHASRADRCICRVLKASGAVMVRCACHRADIVREAAQAGAKLVAEQLEAVVDSTSYSCTFNDSQLEKLSAPLREYLQDKHGPGFAMVVKCKSIEVVEGIHGENFDS